MKRRGSGLITGSVISNAIQYVIFTLFGFLIVPAVVLLISTFAILIGTSNMGSF